MGRWVDFDGGEEMKLDDGGGDGYGFWMDAGDSNACQDEYVGSSVEGVQLTVCCDVSA